ncbi:hypothetical protein AB1N83_000891 [Pleurotus pulmonarius]
MLKTLRARILSRPQVLKIKSSSFKIKSQSRNNAGEPQNRITSANQDPRTWWAISIAVSFVATMVLIGLGGVASLRLLVREKHRQSSRRFQNMHTARLKERLTATV